LIRTSDNHYILGGYTDSKDDVNGDFWIVETNSEGDHIFDEAMGGKRADIAYTVINAQDNEFVMGGKTLSYSSEGYDFWIVKIESPRMLPWYLTGIGIFIVALLGYMVYYSIKKYR
jgi:hypothetical protein